MKNYLNHLTAFAVFSMLGTAALSAQSCAAVDHVSNSVALSGAASREALGAVGESAKGSVKVASAVLAVPVWMSGAVVTGSGAAVSAVGEASAQAGAVATKGADKMWDFATGESAARPALDRELALPSSSTTTKHVIDPTPAEALKTTR